MRLGFCFRGHTAGFVLFIRQTRVFGALVAGQRADHQVDRLADELGLKIWVPVRLDVRDELLDDFKTDLGVRHFPAAEYKRDLHLHVFAKKINGVLELDAQIMRVDARAELHFLDGRSVLVLFGFLFALGELIAELAKVHQLAHRRDGVGRNFNQVHAVLTGQVQRLGQLDDSQLFLIRADDPDLTGANLAIDPDERRGGIITTRSERATQATLSCWSLTVIYCIKILVLTMYFIKSCPLPLQVNNSNKFMTIGERLL